MERQNFKGTPLEPAASLDDSVLLDTPAVLPPETDAPAQPERIVFTNPLDSLVDTEWGISYNSERGFEMQGKVVSESSIDIGPRTRNPKMMNRIVKGMKWIKV